MDSNRSRGLWSRWVSAVRALVKRSVLGYRIFSDCWLLKLDAFICLRWRGREAALRTFRDRIACPACEPTEQGLLRCPLYRGRQESHEGASDTVRTPQVRGPGPE